jgi:transposase
MPGKSISTSKVKQIVLHLSCGTPLKQISKSLLISRNTVKKYKELIKYKGYNFASLLELSDTELETVLDGRGSDINERLVKLEPLFPGFVEELKRTGVTRHMLWVEYRSKIPEGYGYSQFCECFRIWSATRTATMHLEHVPGDKLFIDFTGKKLYLTDPDTGEMKPVEVYVAILGYSQLTYVEAIHSQQKVDFIQATENAMIYFGGATKVIVPDNLKSAVKKANKYEAELNELFLELANHYQTSVLPARSYKPRDKALVENAVNITYKRIFAPLRDKVFFDLFTLNQAIKELLELHNNQPFQRNPTSRRQIFDAEEKELLQPLPDYRFEIKQIREVTVMKNSHVQLHDDSHYYSVPYRFIGKKIKIIYTTTQVAVYYNRERIALHIRTRKPYSYTTQKDHLPSTHQFVSDWNPDKFLSLAENVGPGVKEYITQILNSKAYPEQTYRSCVGILSMEKKFGRDRLIKAIERASEYGVYNYTTISNILTSGLDRLESESSAQSTLPLHENIRGADQYK